MANIVVLTGAGISAESGLETFRSSNGLWANHRIEDVCTPEALERNPDLVFQFYNQRRQQLRNVSPNPGHYALVSLAQEHNLTLITQNVDDLHERAGHKNILHMHGYLNAARCRTCKEVSPYFDDFDATTLCPKCNHPALRPHIVFFGELPFFMEEIYERISQCDMFVAVGTSGTVYPAAGFVQEAKLHNALCVECNIEPSNQEGYFDKVILGKASQTLNQLEALARHL